MSKATKDIVVGFHVALDRGLPIESLSAALTKKFRSWVDRHAQPHRDVPEVNVIGFVSKNWQAIDL